MFGPKTRLFSILGFEVKLDASWFFLAFLITWSLAQGYFPSLYKDLSPQTYWWMGIAGVIGIFGSIIFHELAHSVVARRYDLPIKGITLFIFGGVAEMETEPKSAKAEFMMAIAGPVASFALAVLFYTLSLAAGVLAVADALLGVLTYMALINLMLAIFNLAPAFPLDGGRVFRAALWHWTGNLFWATRVTSRAGTAFGFILMVLGVWSMLQGNFIGGLWWLLIGLFVQSAAASHLVQLQIRLALEGEKVSKFMTPNPVTVNTGMTIRELVDHYVYRYHRKMYPVTAGGHLVGCVRTSAVKEIPQEKWDFMTLHRIMEPCTSDNTISEDEEAVKALERMRRTGSSRLIVTKGGELSGVISLKDLMELFALKMELEQGSG